MVGTRKRGNLKRDAVAIGRAERVAKRQKAQEEEEEAKREQQKLEEQKRLEEEEAERERERKRLREERQKKRERKERSEQRKRQKAKGKFVLEVEYAPEAVAAERLSEPPPTLDKKSGRTYGGMSLTEHWMGMLNKLKEYKMQFGDCRVPRRYKDDISLGNWVRSQRHIYLNNKMSDERRAALEEVGFELVLPPEGFTWEEFLDDLEDYQEKHGNCNIPIGYEENPQLLTWTNYQRELYRKGQLDENQITKLENLGFEWKHRWPGRKAPIKSSDEIWNMQFEKLVKFKRRNGHTDVPNVFGPDMKFSKWVGEQRTAFKKGELPQERIEQLKELGLDLEATRVARIPSQSAPTPEQEAMWQASFNKLKAFKAANGHCDCPVEIHPQLNKWSRAQRTFFQRRQLTEARKAALDSIGFDFGVQADAPVTPGESARRNESVWRSRLEELKKFKEEFGHSNVPGTYARNPVLARWVGTQRTAHRRMQMPQDRVAALEALGFRWRLTDGNEKTANGKPAGGASSAAELEAIWNMQFEKLRVYKMANGHCNVPNTYAPDEKFARWVSTQRTVFRRGQMHQNRLEQLESLGFEFRIGPRGRTWEESLNILKEYKEKHGHCFLPSKGIEDNALKNWVLTNRQKYAKGGLKPEQIAELQSIGFAWTTEEEKDAMWNLRFQQLSEFKKSNGHCGVPTNFPEDPELLEWISRQHSDYFAHKMSSDRIEKLISIGFVFNGDSVPKDGDKKPAASNGRVSWNRHYKALLDFKELYGHASVPINYEQDPRLGQWVRNQRKLYHRGQGPTAERIEKLEAIGFDWTERERRESSSFTISPMPELKAPPAAAATTTATIELIAAAAQATPAEPPGFAAGRVELPRVAAATTPTIAWGRAPPAATTTTATQRNAQQMAVPQRGVQQMAVNLEMERTKLDSENKQLKKANQKLQTANQNLTKKLAEAEASFKKETEDLREKLQMYDEMLSTQGETLESQGRQLALIAQNGTEERLKEQAMTLQTQGNQLTQLAQQVQEMRQMQYTLQHQVGVQGLSYRL